MPQTWDPKAYERNGAFVHQLAGDVLRWLLPRKGERILDLGCGDGQLTQRIVAKGAIVSGVDASPEMVAAARSRGIGSAVAQAESLPFGDGEFDAVFSNAVLHWVRGQDEMMSEVHRVLRKRGRFVAEMGGHGNIAAIRTALFAVLDRHGLRQHEDGVNHFPSPAAYKRRLEKHGFKVRRMALISRPTPMPESGMRGWLGTFRKGVLDALPESARETVINETVELLEQVLRDHDGNWTADYVRLRFVAIS
jgi:trans-aconitate methyltransferase